MAISNNFHGGGRFVAHKDNLHKVPSSEWGRGKWPLR